MFVLAKHDEDERILLRSIWKRGEKNTTRKSTNATDNGYDYSCIENVERVIFFLSFVP